MIWSWMRGFGKRQARSSRGSSARAVHRRTFRPFVEQLEHRLIPATDIWTGAGKNGLWSNPANWSTSNAGGIPVSGDDLVFPGAPASFSSFNDLPGLSMPPANFINSIQINGSGYVIAGNVIPLAFQGINNAVGTNTITAPIDLVGNGGGGAMPMMTNIIAASGTQLFLDGAILSSSFSANPGNITAGVAYNSSPNGRIVIAGSNSYIGNSTISGGFVVLETSSGLGAPNGTGATVTVNSGGSLQLQGSLNISEPLILNGLGAITATSPSGQAYGIGALEAFSGSSTWSGNITLPQTAGIGADPGAQVTIPGQVNDNIGAGNVSAGSALIISGGVNGLPSHTGGTVALTGTTNNTFTGGVNVIEGTLVLNKNPGFVAFGAANATTGNMTVDQTLVVGDGAGAANSAVVLALTTNVIPFQTNANVALGSFGTQVVVNGDGQLNIGGTGDTIAGLTLNSGGNVVINNATLTLAAAAPGSPGFNGDVNVSGGGNITAGPFGGNLALQGGNLLQTPRTFTVDNTGDLVITANVTNGTPASQPVVKTGLGKMILAGSFPNTFGLANNNAGILTVAAGFVTAEKNGALGVGNVTVNSNATLQLQNNITATNPTGNITISNPLTLNGNGAQPSNSSQGYGALENVSGGNTYSGAITLGTNPVTVETDPGSILTITGIIGGGANGLTQLGAGALALNAVNTYTGSTTISGNTTIGTQSFTGGSLGGTGTIAGQVVVNGGGTLFPGVATNALTPPTAARLTINNTLTFRAGSTFEVGQILGPAAGGAGFDQVLMANNIGVNLGNGNATLVVKSINYRAATPTTTYAIISVSGTGTVTGTFAGLPAPTVGGLASVAVTTAGTGYKAGDFVSITGTGANVGTGAAGIVTSVNGTGGILQVAVTAPGSNYTVPTGPVSITGGSGTGALGTGTGSQFTIPNQFPSPDVGTVANMQVTYPAAAANPVNLIFVGTTPKITALNAGPNPVNVNTNTRVNVAFVDPDNDPRNVSISWGDGTTTTTTVPAGPAPDFTTQFNSPTHQYTSGGTFTVLVTVIDNTTNVSTTTALTITAVNTRYAAVSNDLTTEVKVFNIPSNAPVFDFFAYNPAVAPNGVRVAVGDVNGDSIPDIITVPGPGGPPEVKVFDGVTGTVIRDFFAFSGALTTGFFVASNGANQIVVAPDAGAASEVKVFNANTGAALFDFFAYGSFAGGVRVGYGDVNGDGTPDILTVTGPGQPPEAWAFNGVNPNQALRHFFPFGAANIPGGAYIAGGADLNGGAFADIIVGSGAGTSGLINIFSGQTGALLRTFFTYNGPFDGGARVGSVHNFTSGTQSAILIAPGQSPEVGQAQHGSAAGFPPGGVQPELVRDSLSTSILDALFAYGSAFPGGVYIAGNP